MSQSALYATKTCSGQFKTNLCADNNVVSLPAKLLDGLTHHDLGLAIGITTRCQNVTYWQKKWWRTYHSAVSKKLIPKSYACFMQASVPSSAIWPPYLVQIISLIVIALTIMGQGSIRDPSTQRDTRDEKSRVPKSAVKHLGILSCCEGVCRRHDVDLPEKLISEV